jgi:hypothetical protein
MRAGVGGATKLVELDAHINDAAFCEAALARFDRWVAEGVVARPTVDHQRVAAGPARLAGGAVAAGAGGDAPR